MNLKWISVKDRLPDKQMWVVMSDGKKVCDDAMYNATKRVYDIGFKCYHEQECQMEVMWWLEHPGWPEIPKD